MASPFKDFTIRMGPGETVYQEGEPGTIMYVIQSGAVELYREVDGRRVNYGLLEKGDFFGEMSLLLESQPRTTSACVVEEAELVEINSTLFDKMIRGNIEIAVRMMRKISLRLREHEERLLAGVASAPSEEAKPPVEPEPLPPEPPPPAAPAPVPAPAAGKSAQPDLAPGTHAYFKSQDGAYHFPLGTDSAAIGRFDPVTGMRPEVDLSGVDINRSVSRHHARLTRQGGTYSLTEEVGALNGTFVNGTRLTTGKPATIKHGDEVGLGMVRLEFHVVGA